VSIHARQQKVRHGVGRLRAHGWRLVHPGVEIGDGVRVGRGCRLFLDPEAKLVVGDRCVIDDAVTIAVYGTGVIRLGDGAFIGHHATLAAHELIELGAGTFVAELVSIRDHDHAVGTPPSAGETTVQPVEIGADAWIASKVTVLAGARIGTGAVVGANAVALGELPAWTVSVGVPARVVRTVERPGDGAPT
jgi:acetyltransferase-like isoleucine patch superfamily enzyme